jgi:hypothetical protein
VHSSLPLPGRLAKVLAAAALVSLTAACGPLDAGATITTAGDRVSSTRADAAPGSGSRGQAPAGRGHVPATDAPLPQVPQVPAAAPPTAVPTEETPESTTPNPAPQPEETTPQDATPAGGAGTPAGRPGTSAVAPAPTAPTAAAAPAAPVAPASGGSASSGSGGSFADQGRQAFRAGNGLTGQYLLYAGGIDPAKPVGLVVYVDGTGEYGVDNPTSSYALGGSSGLVATAKARNMITLAVESPNQSCECWHTGDTSGYADFLAQLVEAQLGKFAVSDVWLAGFSSGAQEITRFLVPRHPELLRHGGGWVVFGGGGPPADGGAAVTAARMAGVRGHWFTGTADTAVPLTASWGAQAGERFYAGRGVAVSHEYPQGVGHSLDGRLGRTVGAIIDGS